MRFSAERLRKTIRRLSSLMLHGGRHIIDRVSDRGRCLRIGTFKLGAHRSGSRFEQLQEVLAGKVAALTEGQHQLAVITRTDRELAVTGQREARTLVSYDLMNHAAITSLDQNVGDRLAQLQPLRRRSLAPISG